MTPAVTSTLVARQRLAFDMIDRGDPTADVLAVLCHIVEAEALSSVRAAILVKDGDCLRVGAAPGLPDSYNRAVDGIAVAEDVGTCCAAAATGKPVVTPDIESCPRWKGLSHLPLGLGLLAAWSLPITSRDGRVLGTFGTYFTERRPPAVHERQLVGILARTAAEAIERGGATH